MSSCFDTTAARPQWQPSKPSSVSELNTLLRLTPTSAARVTWTRRDDLHPNILGLAETTV